MHCRSLRWLVPLVAWLALSPAAPGGGPDSKEPTLPIATRQNVFSIPFQLEKPATADDEPVEVQLQVSTDEGANWKIATRVKPDAKSFIFRAPHDGEYWFSIRTLNRQGQPRPDGDPEPGLRVAVDTMAPRLELTATRGPAGDVVAHWQVMDLNLRPDSLKLEYQASPGATWKPLAVKSSDQTLARHTLVGETTWWPETSGGPIVLRAQVFDRAGNPASMQVAVADEARTPEDPPQMAARPPAGTFSDDASAGAASSRPWPADRWVDAAPDREVGRSARRPLDPADDEPEQRGKWRSSHDKKAAAQPVARTRQLDDPPTPGPFDNSALPPGERPRMVNSRSFELEYEIDSVGKSGIGKVELWATRDGGKSWRSLGTDDDKRSPMTVSVDDEGIYGFQIAVESGSGLGGEPPQAGDQPEIWVGVDLTKPTAKIVGTQMGRDGSELTIRWEAADDLLESQPVTLAFSQEPDGPWSPIAAGLENSGSYTWRLDNRVPDQIYLQLEVRDEAGNATVVVTADPIELDRQRPQGRIRNVRPTVSQ